MFLLHPSLPIKRSVSVTHPLFTRSSSLNSLTALSTVSCAIALYVVHFPPAMVSNPLGLTYTMWLRTKPSVAPAFGFNTSGRSPLHAERTSPRRTLISGDRYRLISSRIHLISSSRARGSISTCALESVVPAIVFPCHGRKNITRPSEVAGSRRPMVRGE